MMTRDEAQLRFLAASEADRISAYERKLIETAAAGQALADTNHHRPARQGRPRERDRNGSNR